METGPKCCIWIVTPLLLYTKIHKYLRIFYVLSAHLLTITCKLWNCIRVGCFMPIVLKNIMFHWSTQLTDQNKLYRFFNSLIVLLHQFLLYIFECLNLEWQLWDIFFSDFQSTMQNIYGNKELYINLFCTLEKPHVATWQMGFHFKTLMRWWKWMGLPKL